MSRVLLVVLLLLVPLAGLFVSLHVGAVLDFRWQELLGEAGQILGEDAPTLAAMCGMDARLEGTVLCQRQAAADQLGLLAGAALALAAALLLTLLLWAAAVRLLRPALLLFRPCALLLPPLLLLMMLMDGAVLTLALVLVETALYERQAPLAGVAGGLLSGLLLLVCVGPSLRLVRVPRRFLLAHQAEPERHPRLREMVRDIAGQLDAEAPDTLLLGLEPGVWVSGERLYLHPAERRVSGPALYVSVALMHLLSERELAALLAHELSHLEIRERRGTLRVWPAMAALERRLQQRATGWRGLAEWPAATLLDLFLELATAAAWRHQHLREHVADRAGADLASPAAMARALLRLAAAQREWVEQDRDLVRAVAEERRSKNLSRVFRRRIELLPSRPWLDELARVRTGHPVDHHATLMERVESLGLGRDALGRVALLPQDEPAAIALLDDAERLEESLSDEQYLLYRARGYAPSAE